VEKVASSIIERSPPKSCESRAMKVILMDKVLEEPAPRIRTLSALRRNNDMVLLFQHDPKKEDYKYITGKASDGKTCVGIMPLGDIKNHEEIVNAMTRQFSVNITNVKAGWVLILEDSAFVHGNSTRYRENDHETVKKALKSLMPEMRDFSVVAELPKAELLQAA
jgi:hypothetical protein